MNFPKQEIDLFLFGKFLGYTTGPPGQLLYHSSALLDIINVTEKGRLGGSGG